MDLLYVFCFVLFWLVYPFMIFFIILFILYYLIGGYMGTSLRKNLLVDYFKEQFPCVSYTIIVIFSYVYQRIRYVGYNVLYILIFCIK